MKSWALTIGYAWLFWVSVDDLYKWPRIYQKIYIKIYIFNDDSKAANVNGSHVISSTTKSRRTTGSPLGRSFLRCLIKFSCSEKHRISQACLPHATDITEEISSFGGAINSSLRQLHTGLSLGRPAGLIPCTSRASSHPSIFISSLSPLVNNTTAQSLKVQLYFSCKLSCWFKSCWLVLWEMWR